LLCLRRRLRQLLRRWLCSTGRHTSHHTGRRGASGGSLGLLGSTPDLGLLDGFELLLGERLGLAAIARWLAAAGLESGLALRLRSRQLLGLRQTRASTV
jgi:hypothetical protein